MASHLSTVCVLARTSQIRKIEGREQHHECEDAVWKHLQYAVDDGRGHPGRLRQCEHIKLFPSTDRETR
jgi:hypothetical protein